MNDYLAYTSYRCVPADGKEVVIPLSGDVAVSRSLLQIFLTDLRDFTLVSATNPWQSTLEFTIGEATYNIARDHATNSVTITPTTTDIYAEISTKLGANITAQIHAQQLVTPDTQISASQEVLAKLNANSSANPEAAEIEARLAAQRKADEAQLKISELEAKLPEFDAKMTDVDTLAKKQAQLNQLLGKYSYILKPDIQTDEAKYKQEIETIRHDYLQKVLAEQNHPTSSSAESEPAAPFFPRDGLQGKVTLTYALITALAAAISWLASGQTSWLLLGAFLCNLQLVILVVINKVPAAIAWSMRRQIDDHSSQESVSERAPEIKSQQRLSWLEKFFIDKAWVMALQAEAQSLEKTIHTKLDGQDLNSIKEAKQKLQAEIAEYQSHIAAMQGKEIPPEEYLELRRRLERLKAEAGSAESTDSLLASITGGQYVSAVQSGETLRLRDVSGLEVDYAKLPLEARLAVMCVCRILAWKSMPQMPLILADIINRLTADAANAFAKLLQEARAQGQILAINVTA